MQFANTLRFLDETRSTADNMLYEYSTKILELRRNAVPVEERIETLEKAAGLALAGFEHLYRKLSENIMNDLDALEDSPNA